MNKRIKDSIYVSYAILGGIAIFFTIIGISFSAILPLEKTHWVIRYLVYLILLLSCYFALIFIVWIVKLLKYKNSITLRVGDNTVTIKQGDIFDEEGWCVIPMDTTFSTEVDDRVISKNSLHGQFVLNHADISSIRNTVHMEAQKKGMPQKPYHFKLGTIIPYIGLSKENHKTYLMLALTVLNDEFEAHTTMAEYERTLLSMWNEISRVYARNNIVLPLIGSGITRFDDNQCDSSTLLRCILCTLNTSKVRFKSKVTIVIYNDGKNDLPFYEFKEIFKIVR